MDKSKKTEEEYFAREEIEKRHKLHHDLVAREAHAAREQAARDRAESLMNLRRNPEGMKLLLAALEGDPRAADAMLVLADGFRMVHRNQQAQNFYRKYLEIAPNGEGAASARQNLRELAAEGSQQVIRAFTSAFSTNKNKRS